MRHAHQLLTLAAALVVSGTMISTTAHAQTPAGYYVAVPAVQPTRASMMTRATPWALRSNAYVAARAPERDAILCEMVAKNTGALTSFTAGGKAFDADALAKCNAHAKGGLGATEAVAAR